ncbi:MAG: plastocyanin/azurin family copper-binding protein [Burkholderiales bacterium]
MQKLLQVLFLNSALAVFAVPPAVAAGKHAGGHDDEWAKIGRPGDPRKATRTVEIGAYDTMRFNHARFTVKRGETVRIVLRNAGQMPHELVLGDEKSLREHAEQMQKYPGMEHADPNQVSAAPGKTAELTWQFTKVGTVHFACLHPGHYEAGMIGKITVTP